MRVSSMDGSLLKSSCWLRRHAMQHSSLSMGHTREHFAWRWEMLNPLSFRTHFNPFGWPSMDMLWGWPRTKGSGFVSGMMVSCWHLCFPPSDLFILKALRASETKEPWADELLKIKSACLPGCCCSKDTYCFFYLLKELSRVPPGITISTWINYLSSLINDLSFTIFNKADQISQERSLQSLKVGRGPLDFDGIYSPQTFLWFYIIYFER